MIQIGSGVVPLSPDHAVNPKRTTDVLQKPDNSKSYRQREWLAMVTDGNDNLPEPDADDEAFGKLTTAEVAGLKQAQQQARCSDLQLLQAVLQGS